MANTANIGDVAPASNWHSAVILKMKKYSVKTCSNLRFADLTTLGIGGTIKLTVYPNSVRKLIKTVRLLQKLKVNYIVMGKGSNILAGDDAFCGVAVVTTELKGIRINKTRVKVLAGTSTLSLGKALADNGLDGGEFFACLPATLGGAVACNAGCYGQSAQDVVKSVTALVNGRVKKFKNEKCGFSKRNSIFKHSDAVVLWAELQLNNGEKSQITAKIDKMRQAKASSQPLNVRSAGSVFFHDRVAVSRLIDKAGLKGFFIGDAAVSAKHVGFIVNNGSATCADFLQVMRVVQNTVFDNFGIMPKREIALINVKEENDVFTRG